MNCPKCNHEDYAVNATATNTGTVMISFTIPVNATTTATNTAVPIMQFHLDCECCKAGHK